MKVAQKLLESLKVTNREILNTVKEAIANGKVSILTLKQTVEGRVASIGKNNIGPIGHQDIQENLTSEN